MKHIAAKLLVLFFLFLFSILFELRAEDVKQADIKKIALNAFSYYSGKAQSDLKIVEIIPITQQDTILLYVFNFETGFVIVSADNIAEPVLGFSTTSKLDFTDMPPALQGLLEGYTQEIAYAKRQNTKASQEVSDKWNYYTYLHLSKTLYTPATYLVTTQWNQNGVGDVYTTTPYNYYCPKIGTARALVGCNGVALAQILNFWSCQVHPQGTVTYNHPGLPQISINFANQSYNWGNMLPNQANTNNALLLYHCAVAMQSEFGISATAASPGMATIALSNNFGFVSIGRGKDDYTNQAWIDLLKIEINNRRPIFYVGWVPNSALGHTWVVDGYNSSNYFHCNWGWGGSYDGWYLLSNLTPGTYNFNNYQNAVMDIRPAYYSTNLIQNTTITAGTYTGHAIIIDNCNIQSNANVILQAGCTTEIYGSFEVPVGATLTIQ